jgi:hypothetical protein
MSSSKNTPSNAKIEITKILSNNHIYKIYTGITITILTLFIIFSMMICVATIIEYYSNSTDNNPLFALAFKRTFIPFIIIVIFVGTIIGLHTF